MRISKPWGIAALDRISLLLISKNYNHCFHIFITHILKFDWKYNLHSWTNIYNIYIGMSKCLNKVLNTSLGVCACFGILAVSVVLHGWNTLTCRNSSVWHIRPSLVSIVQILVSVLVYTHLYELQHLYEVFTRCGALFDGVVTTAFWTVKRFGKNQLKIIALNKTWWWWWFKMIEMLMGLWRWLCL